MSTGVFGKTEWDVKIPGLPSEDRRMALKRLLLVWPL